MTAELYLVRHGETVGESAVRLYGRTDIPLSDSGREQMRCAGLALRDVDFEAVYTSPLQRSLESARIIMAGRTPRPRALPEFMEINFGTWEGWTLPEARERDPGNYRAWQTSGADFAFPDGDTKRTFFERAGRAARQVFGAHSGRVLAVLHKGVIKGALAGLLQRPVDAFANHCIELGSIHMLRRCDDGWQLTESGRTDHLAGCRIPESG